VLFCFFFGGGATVQLPLVHDTIKQIKNK
jgi:hypothetical protein